MDPFESSFTKVATLAELNPGEPRVFRAAGAMLVLRRDQDERVEAVDGSCFSNDQSIPSETRVRQILDCVASGAGSSSTEWSELVREAGLPVKVVEGDVWVCLEECR